MPPTNHREICIFSHFLVRVQVRQLSYQTQKKYINIGNPGFNFFLKSMAAKFLSTYQGLLIYVDGGNDLAKNHERRTKVWSVFNRC